MCMKGGGGCYVIHLAAKRAPPAWKSLGTTALDNHVLSCCLKKRLVNLVLLPLFVPFFPAFFVQRNPTLGQISLSVELISLGCLFSLKK